MMKGSLSRRDFVRIGAGAVAAGAAASSAWADKAKSQALSADMPDTSGRKTRFISIGTGIRGCDLLRAAAKVPNSECVGTADLYTMHQKAGVEAYGKEIPTVRDYRSLLDRKDVDAVIVAVADFQHRRVVLDCVEAGKDVYCEKPMSHNVADGLAMVEAVQKHKRIFQAGSQRVSSPVFKKAAEIVKAGRLGEITLIEGHTDRNSDSGAWVYPIPPDASPETIDWKSWIRDAPDRPYDAARFFRWRCWADYGEGVAGDLFVHLLSGIQCATGINAIPNRAFSMGSLTHFKDGRDFPDLLATMYDYNGVTVKLHCNQNNDADGDVTTLFGKEGTLVIKDNTVTFTPQNTHPQPEWYSTDGWTAELKKKYYDDWAAAHPQKYDAPLAETYSEPQGFDSSVAHIANFFRAIDTREHVLEDEVFGNNTAVACHMANHSYFHRKVAAWDAESKTIKS
ncbi:MAG TPA: Gfo/Idh/MocA family oxidoreductase [Terracidiphilus sp.]